MRSSSSKQVLPAQGIGLVAEDCASSMHGCVFLLESRALLFDCINTAAFLSATPAEAKWGHPKNPKESPRVFEEQPGVTREVLYVPCASKSGMVIS